MITDEDWEMLIERFGQETMSKIAQDIIKRDLEEEMRDAKYN